MVGIASWRDEPPPLRITASANVLLDVTASSAFGPTHGSPKWLREAEMTNVLSVDMQNLDKT